MPLIAPAGSMDGIPKESNMIHVPYYQGSTSSHAGTYGLYSYIESSDEILANLEVKLRNVRDTPLTMEVEIDTVRWLLQVMQSYTQAPQVLTVAMQCVIKLCQRGYCQVLGKLGALGLAIQMLDDWPDHEGLVEYGIIAILNLSCFPDNRERLFDLGKDALDCLLHVVSHENPKIVANAIHILWNLTTSMTRGVLVVSTPGCTDVILDVLNRRHREGYMVSTGVGLLWAMASLDDGCRGTIYAKAGWLLWLMGLMQKEPENGALLTNGLGLLSILIQWNDIFAAWLVTFHDRLLPTLKLAWEYHSEDLPVCEQIMGLLAGLATVPAFRVSQGIPDFSDDNESQCPSTPTSASFLINHDASGSFRRGSQGSHVSIGPSQEGGKEEQPLESAGTIEILVKFAAHRKSPYNVELDKDVLRTWLQLEVDGYVAKTSIQEGNFPVYEETLTLPVSIATTKIQWEVLHQPMEGSVAPGLITCNKGEFSFEEILAQGIAQKYEKDSQLYSYPVHELYKDCYPTWDPEAPLTELELAVPSLPEFAIPKEPETPAKSPKRKRSSSRRATIDTKCLTKQINLSAMLEPEGVLFDILEIMDGQRMSDVIIECLRRYIPETDAEGVLASGFSAMAAVCSIPRYRDPFTQQESAVLAIAHLRRVLNKPAPANKTRMLEVFEPDDLLAHENTVESGDSNDYGPQFPASYLPIPPLPPPSLIHPPEYPHGPTCNSSAVQTLVVMAQLEDGQKIAPCLRIGHQLLLRATLAALAELCQDQKEMEYAMENHVVELTCQCIKLFPGRLDIFNPAMQILRHVCTNGRMSKNIVLCGGVPLIMKALKKNMHDAVLQKGCYEVLESLCIDMGARTIIAKNSGLKIIINSMEVHHNNKPVIEAIIPAMQIILTGLDNVRDMFPKGVDIIRMIKTKRKQSPWMVNLCEMSLNSIMDRA